MLKLLVFTPCERVIVSEDENTASLMVLLEVVNIAVPVGTDVPKNAMVPFRWTVYALWHFVPDDVGVGEQFEQRTVLIAPDGQPHFETVLPFTVPPESRNHRTLQQFVGFPFMPAGESVLKLSLRRVSEGEEWDDIAEYPIRVDRVQ